MRVVSALTAFLTIALAGAAAVAKPARCFTTDDGPYGCDFELVDSAGSFRIAAPGKPSFTLLIESGGVAFGFADFGSGDVALPGRFIRSRQDRACWENDATATRICAW